MPIILNVDDDQPSRAALSAILRHHAYDVREAACGMDALRQISQGVDCVLLDVGLPDIDGFEVCRRIKADASTASIPVLFVSGSVVAVQDRLRGLEGGANAYLLKPVEPIELLATIRNLLRLRQAETQVRKLEARYRMLIEHIPAVTFTAALDGDTNELYVSPHIEELLGFTQEEWLGNPILWYTQLHPDDRSRWQEEFARTCASGQPIRSVYRFLTRKGSIVWVQGEARMLCDPAGRPLYLHGVAFDITDRVKAEQALRYSEERYRQIFEDDLTGDLVAAADGTLLACNPAFARIFGFAGAGEAVGRNFFDLFAQRQAQEMLMERLRKEKRLAYQQVELRRADGQPIHAIANLVGTFDSKGNLTQITGYLIDNTERTRLEEQYRQSQKMEAVGQLASGVAHDFNNLLTVIAGYSEYLIGELAERGTLRQVAEEIFKAGERAAALTQQLLAFGRKQVLEPRILDLNVIVRDVAKILQRTIGEHIRLSTAFAAGLWHVNADAGQLGQVLLNLAVNARDAMPRGGQMTIETGNVELGGGYVTRPEIKPGRYVMLAVSDTGCGMSAEVKDRIFEPFFTTKGPGKGTGLGLATVYGIVNQSGGHIYVYSEPNQGTSFKVYLPAVEGELAQPRVPPVAAAPQGEETILLIEDDATVRSVICMSLEILNYHVLEASRGEEAIRVCQEYSKPIHLIITDLVMPEMDGFELVRRLQTLRPGLQALYMSGYAADAVIRHGILEPPAAFLQKPFSAKSLGNKVREVLSRRGSE